MTRLTQSVALACGTAGAFVDVSSYANLLDGTSRSWGRQSEFEDTAPGTFSFTLDNSDGRFNPGSTTLATPVTEGMQVCWQLGSRLVAGTILAIEPSFPEAESAWAQVTITCDDMLGNAARYELGDWAETLFVSAGGLALWRLDDAVGSAFAVEDLAGFHNLIASTPPVTFGVAAPEITKGTVVSVGAGGVLELAPGFPNPPVGAAPVLDGGAWNFWVNQSLNASFLVTGGLYRWNGVVTSLTIRNTGGSITAQITDGGVITGPAILPGVWYFVSVTVENIDPFADPEQAYELWVDGVSYGSSVTSSTGSPATNWASMTLSNSGLGTVAFSRLSLSESTYNESTLGSVSAEQRLVGLAATVPEITLDTPPTMAPAILGVQDTSGQSALDAINAAIKAEQGAIYSVTTGTLTAPVEKVTVRARDRVTAVDYTFNVETEASGATDFIRDITNMVQTVTVDGTDTSVTYTETTLADRVGSKNASESVPLRDRTDLHVWGTDRVWRGANVALRAASLTIDALTTPTDRTADLLALIPGDRIQTTGLPSSLGFTTWDGWLLGVDEQHSLTEHTFTLYLQPCLPTTAIYDTSRWMAGGVLTLFADINSSVTSISVETSDTLTKFTTAGGDFPVDIIIGDEEMTATACTSATPQVMTVTRGVNGTTAAAHTDGDALELVIPSLYAF